MTAMTYPQPYCAILRKPFHSAKPWQVVLYAFGGCYFQGEFETRDDAENHLEYLHKRTVFGGSDA